MWQQTAALIET